MAMEKEPTKMRSPLLLSHKGTSLQATSFFKKVYVHMFVCAHVCMCHSAHVKGREQLLGAGPLFH